MRKVTFILTAIAAASHSASFTAHGAFFLNEWESEHEKSRDLRLIPEAGLYSSTANYDPVGAATIPAGFSKVTKLTTDLKLRAGVWRELTLYGKLNWGRVQLDHTTQASSVFGLGDQLLGINYRVLQIPTISIDVQAQMDFPAYSNSNNAIQFNPYLGDNSTDFTFGAFTQLPFALSRSYGLLLRAGGGYAKRGSGFSSHLPWSAGAKLVPLDNGFYAKLSFHGVQSLKTDINAPGGEPVSAAAIASAGTGAGGSYTVNAINPSLTWLQARAGYQVSSQILIYAQVRQSIAGLSSPRGNWFGLGLEASWGASAKPSKANPFNQSPQEYGKPNSGFIGYSLTAKAIRVNDRMAQIKIDKGHHEGVEIGQNFDVFSLNKSGEVKEAVARAQVIAVSESEATLTVSEFYKEVWIEEGMILKRPVQ